MDTRQARIVLTGAATVLASLLFISTLAQAAFPSFSHPSDEEGNAFSSSESLNTQEGGDTAKNAPLPARTPVRLRVPALGVNAAVQRVGETAAGKMGVPSNYGDVAWYRLGAAPGEQGSAVIAGHVDNALGLAGVFADLEDLKPGDELLVERADGETLRFVVIEVASYPYAEVPLERLFGRTDGRYVNLITCDGAWLKRERTYDRRLVVFAELR